MASPEELFTNQAPVRASVAVQGVGFAEPAFDPLRAINTQRWFMIGVVCLLFVLLNGVVCWLINKTIDLEFAQLASGNALPDSQRIITNGVFMALIGATVVQTGLVVKAISDFLFKADQPGD